MKLAIIERLENYDKDKPFYKKYYLDNSFREIFDKLNVLLIPVISENNLEEIVNMCDGLILPGSVIGVDPKYYNDIPFPGKEYKYDEYKLDKKIIDLFVRDKKPILGICGGMQTLNVYFGGDLDQNISNHKLIDGSKHNIKINSNTFLKRVYNKDKIEVNSYHRQAIRKLATNFKIAATSEDGIVEAIEDNNIIGVQWHPEVLYDLDIFKCFIDEFCNKSIK